MSRPSYVKVLFVSTADLLVLVLMATLCVELSTYEAQLASIGGIASFIILAPAASVLAMSALGSYRAIVRFIGADHLLKVIGGASLGGLAAGVAPRGVGVLSIGYQGTLLFITGGAVAMIAMRGLVASLLRPVRSDGKQRDRAVIYGAGEAGAQLAAALAVSGRFHVIAFVDDRRDLQGRTLLGLPIFAPDRLQRLRDEGATRVLLAMPSIKGVRRRQLLESLACLAVKVMVMPNLDELASGEQQLDELREVRVEDLLSRNSVSPDPVLLEAHIKDKVVMVTGAGGSIGSELCRQAILLGARKLVMLDVCEYALYQIDRDLGARARRRGCTLVPLLGNVTDLTQLRRMLDEHPIEAIYHAAAYKHVPLVEQNILAAVHNNIFGTLSMVQAARERGVANFVLVSTDKAVRPTSVMGASKRVCELIVQAEAMADSGLHFSIVRFGNVLASSGSVVPLFQKQIRSGGPVTVTHPEVTRYFMTIREAAQLVIQASTIGKSGEVLVLDMGQPVRILDLAERMINLSGLQVKSESYPDGDIEIQFTGLRPGEKLYEELLIGNDPQATDHPRIFRALETCLERDELRKKLDLLQEAVKHQDADRAERQLRALAMDFGEVLPADTGSAPGVQSKTVVPIMRSEASGPRVRFEPAT